MRSDPRVRLAALGLVVLIGGILAFGLANRPPAPARTVQVASLDEAVAVGMLDAAVLEELRAAGSAPAIVHLDTQSILGAIRSTIGADRAAALVGAMTAAFKANKAAIRSALGPEVELLEDFERLGAFVATFRSEATLLATLRSNLVREVTEDRTVPVAADLEVGPAPAPMDLGVLAPYDGAGVAVGVLDTGVDAARYPEYFPAGSIAQTFEAGPEDFLPDNDGHGTHVASTVLLEAPKAQVYVADVFSLREIEGELENRAPLTSVLRGMDWLLQLRQTGVNLRAVNLSLGHGHYPPSICADHYHLAEAYAVGMIPVVSAGNSAFRDDDDKPTPTWQGGLGSTACNDSAFSVGAATSGTCPDGLVDTVATFSQSGPGLELLAPGACITAAGGSMSGTSMAAPHVAGAVAVLASAKPGALAYEIWTALMSAGPLITDPNSGETRHRLDIPGAVNALLGVTGSLPTPQPGVVRGLALGVSTISPTSALEPGESLDLDPIAVRNVGTVVATYDVVAGAPAGGFVTPAPASWFAFARDAITLGPGDIGEIAVRVNVPSGAAAGVYAGEIRFADREAAAGEATKVVDVSLVVFGEADDGSTGPGPGSGSPGGSFEDDLGELLDNPLVIIVGIVLVVWALRRLFGGSRRPGTPPNR